MTILKKLEKIDEHFQNAEYHSFDKMKELPKEGGVYCVYKDNEAFYVGISGNLRTRLHTHFKDAFLGKNINHVGAITIKEIYPDNNLTDFQFKYFVENDLNLYSLYERYLICLYQETLLNKK